MHILLTGATGLLGNAVACEFKNDSITAIVRQIPEHKSDNINYLQLDLSETIPTNKLPKKIDAIIHLAQSLNYNDFPDSAVDIFQVNTASTAHLLKYASNAGAKYFFYASTGSIYEPYQNPLDELTRVNPQSYYAVSKHASEQLLLTYQKHLTVCAFRLFFLYGKRNTRNLISRLVTCVDQGNPIQVEGPDGGLHFNPTHVDDVAQLIHRALIEKWSGITNVAAFESTTIQDVAILIGKLLDKKPQLQHIEEVTPPAMVPNLIRLKNRCPDVSFKSLEEGLILTLQ